VKNQWGQEIDKGDIVGYVNKTGSYTERKLGVVEGFGQRENWGSNPENTLHVYWLWDGSYGLAQDHPHKGTVGVSRVFKLDPASLDATVREGLEKAAERAK
jgi:hypothetical protein